MISRERHRATTRLCDTLKHFDNEFTKASYETSVRRAWGQRRAHESKSLCQSLTARTRDERATSVRATARTRERKFISKVSPRVGETSVRRAYGQPCADENDILT